MSRTAPDDRPAEDLVGLCKAQAMGEVCVLPCGTAPDELLSAVLDGREVGCVDEDHDGCRRVRQLAHRHRGGSHVHVRQGPVDVVVGPDESFDLIVDALPTPTLAPERRRAHRHVMSLVGPALTLAELQLSSHGALVLALVDRGQVETVQDYLVDHRELRLTEVLELASGPVMRVRRRRRA